MDSETIPSSTQLATAEAIVPSVQIAILMATDLDQIRNIYGDECADYVVRTWQESANPRWDEVMHNALKHWTIQHPRLVLDLDF